jgi:hypothetical protein
MGELGRMEIKRVDSAKHLAFNTRLVDIAAGRGQIPA